jgi:hypothetical protein
MSRRYMKYLGRIVALAEERGGLSPFTVDPDLLEEAGMNGYLARLLQAARDLDAESVRQADEDPVLRDLLGPY